MALLAAHVCGVVCAATVCVDGAAYWANIIHATAHTFGKLGIHPEYRIEFRKIQREKNVIHTRMMINHTRAD